MNQILNYILKPDQEFISTFIGDNFSEEGSYQIGDLFVYQLTFNQLYDSILAYHIEANGNFIKPNTLSPFSSDEKILKFLRRHGYNIVSIEKDTYPIVIYGKASLLIQDRLYVSNERRNFLLSEYQNAVEDCLSTNSSLDYLFIQEVATEFNIPVTECIPVEYEPEISRYTNFILNEEPITYVLSSKLSLKEIVSNFYKGAYPELLKFVDKIKMITSNLYQIPIWGLDDIDIYLNSKEIRYETLTFKDPIIQNGSYVLGDFSYSPFSHKVNDELLKDLWETGVLFTNWAKVWYRKHGKLSSYMFLNMKLPNKEDELISYLESLLI